MRKSPNLSPAYRNRLSEEMSRRNALVSATKTVEYYRSKLKSNTVESVNGCWLWKGMLKHNGYGETYFHGRYWRVHRVAYLLWVGEIPSGFDVCHTCDIRHCINPGHLWTGTRAMNNLDCRSKGRHRNGFPKMDGGR